MIYAVVFALQSEQIARYCFDQCGKVVLGMVEDEALGTLSTCRETNCPFLHAQIDEPFGEIRGEPVCLRRLVD